MGGGQGQALGVGVGVEGSGVGVGFGGRETREHLRVRVVRGAVRVGVRPLEAGVVAHEDGGALAAADDREVLVPAEAAHLALRAVEPQLVAHHLDHTQADALRVAVDGDGGGEGRRGGRGGGLRSRLGRELRSVASPLRARLQHLRWRRRRRRRQRGVVCRWRRRRVPRVEGEVVEMRRLGAPQGRSGDVQLERADEVAAVAARHQLRRAKGRRAACPRAQRRVHDLGLRARRDAHAQRDRGALGGGAAGLGERHAHLEAGDPEPRPNAQLHRALDAAEGVEVEGRVGKAARRHRTPPAARRHVGPTQAPVDAHRDREWHEAADVRREIHLEWQVTALVRARGLKIDKHLRPVVYRAKAQDVRPCAIGVLEVRHRHANGAHVPRRSQKVVELRPLLVPRAGHSDWRQAGGGAGAEGVVLLVRVG